MTDQPRLTTEPDARRVDEWCEIMHDAYERAAVGAGWETNPESRKPWADVPEANQATMRAAVTAIIEHAEREFAQVAQRPGSLTFTGMPSPLGNARPVTRLIDATSSTLDIRATLEGMAVGERGILVALAAEILAVDAASRYPQRWVATGTAQLDEQLDPQGRPLRPSISGHSGTPGDCSHPDCRAARP